MSRNLYILAAALIGFSLLSLAVSWTHASHEPGLPGEAQMWRAMALILFLVGALSCLSGVVINMFEQASRHHDDRVSQRRRRPPQ